MKGEHYFWHVLAKSLGRTVREAQESMTSLEFVDWLAFHVMEREKEMNNPSIDHSYLARIVMAISAIFHKSPSSLKLENFLLKFSSSDKKVVVDNQERLNKSKSIWAAIGARFGFKKKEPPISMSGLNEGDI